MPSMKTVTDRLLLTPPQEDDLADLFAIHSDPRVWTHLPQGRHDTVERTRAQMQRARTGWEANGLDEWTVRLREDERIIGWGGCRLVRGEAWNLGYRLAPSVQGSGLGAELARAAIAAAHAARPGLPVVAMMLTINPSSEAVARKVGFALRFEGPDPTAGGMPCRVYSDAPLDDEALARYLAPA
jgi:RimJ/RimL family protein N-acetyltransferase